MHFIISIAHVRRYYHFQFWIRKQTLTNLNTLFALKLWYPIRLHVIYIAIVPFEALFLVAPLTKPSSEDL